MRLYLSSVLAAALALAGCRGGDPCGSICGCVSDNGGDPETCQRVCAQVSVVSQNPSGDCRSTLGANGVDQCMAGCDDFEPAAPGDQLGRCGDGVDAMTVGDSFTCDLGQTLFIDYVALSVGCWDGESGEFTLRFDTGETVSMHGDCGSSQHLGRTGASAIEVIFESGGGDDGVISFTNYGSLGLVIGYR